MGVGTGEGVPPPVTARGSGAKLQPLFLLLHLFSMKIYILLTELSKQLNVISFVIMKLQISKGNNYMY